MHISAQLLTTAVRHHREMSYYTPSNITDTVNEVIIWDFQHHIQIKKKNEINNDQYLLNKLNANQAYWDE